MTLQHVALAFAILILARSIQAAEPAGELLVLEKDTTTLALVDPADLQITARVSAGPDPHEVVASSDGGRAYVSNYGGEGSTLHIISRVDLTTHKPLPPIDLGGLYSAHGLDFKGGKLYFTVESSKAIGRYDPSSDRVEWVMGTGQDRTHMISVAEDLEHIYVSNVRSGSISILESARRRMFPALPPGVPLPKGFTREQLEQLTTVWEVTTVPAGRGAEGFDLSPDGRQLWAANAQDDTVTVIDPVAKKALQTFAIPLSGANRLKFTRDGRYVLISGLGRFGARAPGTNDLIVIDAASRRIARAFDLGGGAAGILIAPDGSRAYVAVSQADKVVVVDLTTLELRGRISPLRRPDGLAWAGRPARTHAGTTER